MPRDRTCKGQKEAMKDYSNTELAWLIDEYVHNLKYREILKDRLIDGLTYSEIAALRNYSDRQIRNIVYKCEEKIFSKGLDCKKKT